MDIMRRLHSASVFSEFGLSYDYKPGKMPGPVWDSSANCLLEEPLDTSTVVSVDVWKKFDLDLPQEYYSCFEDTFEDVRLPEFQGSRCMESSEIRHHDCMWAGLCISKEHKSTLTTKIDPQVHRIVPAGRSLLIPKAEPFSQQTQKQSVCRRKDRESDGDSTRPETPQTSDESESDYEPPIFRHDQISINERLSECLSETAINAAPISVVTGQQVKTIKKRMDKVKDDKVKEETIVKKETDVRYTLSDHCYHLKKLEHLGVQTPSDSGETGSSSDTEEEIDVVSFEKPSKQTIGLPSFPSPADHEQLQYTVKTAFKEKPSRPRGRPPLAANAKKRAAAAPPSSVPKSAKRTKRSKTHQKRCKYSDIDDIPLPPTNGIKCIPPSTPSRDSSDEEPDTEKRSLHNNMERQRRIDLRHAFEDLRLLVPAVEHSEKAPKVSILRQAAAYCDKMTKDDEVYTVEVTELQNRQERLRARLSQLRKDFANSR